jgi:hypothetical protein
MEVSENEKNFFSLVSWDGMRLIPLGTSATISDIDIVPDLDNTWWWVWSNRWNEKFQGKPQYSEKTLPQCHFVHQKSHMTSHGLESWPPPPELWQGLRLNRMLDAPSAIINVVLIKLHGLGVRLSNSDQSVKPVARHFTDWTHCCHFDVRDFSIHLTQPNPSRKFNPAYRVVFYRVMTGMIYIAFLRKHFDTQH